jgi:hypothetical protein
MTLQQWSKREDLRQNLGSFLDSQAGAAALELLRKSALVTASSACPQGVDFQQWNAHWGSWREGYAKALRDLEALPLHDLSIKQDQNADLQPWAYVSPEES